MKATLDTRWRGAEARLVDSTQNSNGRVYHTLEVTGEDGGGQIDLIAYDEGLYHIVSAIVCTLAEIHGVADVASGLLNQFGTETGRALAVALIGDCDERERVFASGGGVLR